METTGCIVSRAISVLGYQVFKSYLGLYHRSVALQYNVDEKQSHQKFDKKTCHTPNKLSHNKICYLRQCYFTFHTILLLKIPLLVHVNPSKTGLLLAFCRQTNH